MQALKREGLIDRLDMEGTGSVAIEDIVRLINMEEETFFRNRDLYLIYQRMLRKSASRETLSVDSFISVLSR